MRVIRRVFGAAVACALLLGSLFFIRLQLSDKGQHRPAAPDLFLPGVARYRTSRVCSNRALVLVVSDPAASARRQAIRETWAHPSVTQSMDISVAFGVGPTDDVDVQRSLDWEAEIFGDIFQTTADEAGVVKGVKSSFKVMELLKTAQNACTPLPEFVLKSEDGVFVNPFSFAELLENLDTYSSSNTMWCLEYNRQLDNLFSNTTWVVLKTQPNTVGHHPNYCTGTVYLMTGRAMSALIRRHEVQTTKTLLPEEVYITGMLVKEARVVSSVLGERFAFGGQSEEVDADKVAFVRLGENADEDMSKLWRDLVKQKLDESMNRRSDIGL